MNTEKKYTPKVSVLMPAYNAEKYIKEAIESVLNQTYKDFELIVVNDGSKDRTKQCIYSIKDERIVYLENDGNKGLAYTRNRLISEAKGDYISWLDADDVFHPTILEKQVLFLSNQTKSDVVTTWAKVIDGNSVPTGQYFKSYATPEELPVVFLFVNYIVQSSVMARKAIFHEFKFKEDFPVILDYEIWTRIADNYSITILKEILVNYRIHSLNMSIVDGGVAINAIKRFYRERFDKFNLHYTESIIDLQYNLSFENSTKDTNELFEVEKHLKSLISNDAIKTSFDKNAIKTIISHRWVKVCTRDTKMSWSAISKCVNSTLFVFNFRNTALVTQYMLRVLTGKK